MYLLRKLALKNPLVLSLDNLNLPSSTENERNGKGSKAFIVYYTFNTSTVSTLVLIPLLILIIFPCDSQQTIEHKTINLPPTYTHSDPFFPE